MLLGPNNCSNKDLIPQVNNAFFQHVYDIAIQNPYLFSTNVKVPAYFDFDGSNLLLYHPGFPVFLPLAFPGFS